MLNYGVSIQLVSPASGDQSRLMKEFKYYLNFHSISFPNEWGAHAVKIHKKYGSGAVAFPFNQFPQRVGSAVYTVDGRDARRHGSLSIQLVSPTSGDEGLPDFRTFFKAPEFPFNQFPQRVGTIAKIQAFVKMSVSIQLVSPASGESSPQRLYPERDSAIKSTHR